MEMRLPAVVLSAFLAAACTIHTTNGPTHAQPSSPAPEPPPPAAAPPPATPPPAAPPPAAPPPAATPAPAPTAKPKPLPPPPAPKPDAKPDPVVQKPPPLKPKPQPPFKPTPQPTEKPIEKVAAEFGKPKDLQPGLPDQYWVYQDHAGWHLRTTTATPEPRRFTGRLWVTEGKFIEIKSTRIELKDRVRDTPTAIEFDFETMGDIDGFDFKLDGAKCMNLKLTITGKSEPQLVNVGFKKAHPTKDVFQICP